MDGNFISTDIRYRDMIKSRRRSTSYGKLKSPGGASVRSKSVDVGASGGAIGSIHEEVGAVLGTGADSGGANVLVDEVFEEPNTRGGGATGIEEAIGGDGGVEIQLDESVGASMEVANLTEGMEGGEVPGVCVDDIDKVDGDGGAVGGVEVPVIGEKEKGGEEPSREVPTEGEIGGNVANDGNGVEDVYGMGGFEGHGGGGAEGGCGASGVSGDSVVEPVHHIPRWKLREILAHAEGECILSVMLLCAYR